MQRHGIHFLIGPVVILIAIGLVMLFSTSAFAEDSHGDIYYFVKRQALWLSIGTLVFLGAAAIDYHWWQKTWWIWFVLAVVLLALCFIPPIGMKINGSWRWIRVGPFSYQPSEMAKVASVIFLAWWYSKYESEAGSLIKGLLIPGLVVGVLLGLIVTEEDLGTTALITAVMVCMMFVAGANLKALMAGGIAALSGIVIISLNMEERFKRWMAFLNPEEHRLGEGLQQWQALIALGSGGVEGLGLGEGRQKMLYLPYAHTDFIFPMVGEELGLRVTLLVVFCFLALTLGGVLIAMNARDRFGMLLGFGCIMTLALQAVVNIGVTTSLLPNKGMPLPFISYGGSNLLLCLFIAGTLVSIHRYGKQWNNLPPRRLMVAARVSARI